MDEHTGQESLEENHTERKNPNPRERGLLMGYLSLEIVVYVNNKITKHNMIS